MIIKIKKYKELPFEVGKIYQTKFATGERFTITNIVKKSDGKILWFEGVYEKHPQCGICPLNSDRLIADKVEDGEIEICSKCGESIER